MDSPSLLTIRSFSDTSLRGFMLAKLNQAAEMGKAIAAEQRTMIDCLAEAEIARILLDSREELLRILDSRQAEIQFGRGGEIVR